MNEFHLSHLERGTPFRESLRIKPSFSTEKLDRAQAILSDALRTHGAASVTHENYGKIAELMHKDERWHGLYSAGSEFEHALKSHIGIAEPKQ